MSEHTIMYFLCKFLNFYVGFPLMGVNLLISFHAKCTKEKASFFIKVTTSKGGSFLRGLLSDITYHPRTAHTFRIGVEFG